MSSRLRYAVWISLATLSPALAADDGAALFKKNCQTCHSIEKGAAPRQGPPLFGVIGRKAGTVEGFRYSEGLKTAGWDWTPEKIDEWITFPKKMIRTTTMVYRQNDPEIRKAIIAFLETQKD
jgi:cytochrome c